MTDKNITLPVTGMTCANCALNIQRNLKKVKGVKEANVNFATEQATVSFDLEKVQIKDLADKIHDAGYGVVTATVEIPVTGMTCVLLGSDQAIPLIFKRYRSKNRCFQALKDHFHVKIAILSQRSNSCLGPTPASSRML